MIAPSISLTAPAKVNLSLRLPARYDDGFHQICSLVIPLTICDVVSASAGRDSHAGSKVLVSFEDYLGSCITRWEHSDAEEVASHKALNSFDNIAIKAVNELLVSGGLTHQSIQLEIIKSIPLRSGLGGGSADAAAALRAVNQLLGLEFSEEKLYKIGAKIGSDVCVALSRSLAYVSGRGERVELVSLRAPLRSWFESLGVIVVRPEVGVSTPWAYGRFREMNTGIPVITYGSAEDTHIAQRERDFLGIQSGSEGAVLEWSPKDPWVEFEQIARNDFESVLKLPQISATKDALTRTGARVTLLSGSGSACVGIYETETAAQVASRLLQAQPSWFVSVCRFCPEASLSERILG